MGLKSSNHRLAVTLLGELEILEEIYHMIRKEGRWTLVEKPYMMSLCFMGLLLENVVSG